MNLMNNMQNNLRRFDMNGKKKLIVLLAAIVVAVAAVFGVVLSVVSCKDTDNSESVDNGIARTRNTIALRKTKSMSLL